MLLEFDVEDISIVGIDLPLRVDLFQAYQMHLPPHLASAADSRKNDFVAGRICAFKAADMLGNQLLNLPISSDRSPLWPNGLCGSISHSKKLAVSCIGLTENYLSLGIDAEELISNSLDIKSIVANEKELLLLQESPQLGITVLFSAKEALYKALYPLVKQFIDFKEVELTKLNFEERSFEIRVLDIELKRKGYISFEGTYQRKDNTIITLVKIRH